MSNTFATTSIVAKESLAILENMLGFSTAVNRDYESEFKSNLARGYAPGETIFIKKPPRYAYRAGRIAEPQATNEGKIPLTLSQGGTDLFVNSGERTLSITSNTWQNMLKSAMATIANQIDLQGLMMAKNAAFNSVGTPGQPPTNAAESLALITQANAKLDMMGAPRDGERAMALSPTMNGQLVTGLAGLFNSQSTLDKQYKKGVMVDALGLNFFMDQNVVSHSNGTQAPTGLTVNGANQSGDVLTVNATTGTITRGSTFSIAGVFAVNPQSRQSTGQLAQFVARADVAAGATTIPISPAITFSGNYQNVSASPANGAAITIVGTANGTSVAGIAYHRDAFTLAMVPMWKPTEMAKVHQETHKGFTMKVTEVYDGKADESIIRFDVLFGWASPYPELAVKIFG